MFYSFRCKIPGYPHDTYDIHSEEHRTLVNTSIPLKENDDGELEYDKCSYYVVNVSDVSAGRAGKRECDSWVYDKSIFKSTFTAEVGMILSEGKRKKNKDFIIFLCYCKTNSYCIIWVDRWAWCRAKPTKAAFHVHCCQKVQ